MNYEEVQFCKTCRLCRNSFQLVSSPKSKSEVQSFRYKGKSLIKRECTVIALGILCENFETKLKILFLSRFFRNDVTDNEEDSLSLFEQINELEGNELSFHFSFVGKTQLSIGINVLAESRSAKSFRACVSSIQLNVPFRVNPPS